MIQYILAQDVASPWKGKIYARKGDTVNLIKDCGEALIVEDKHGLRFPINTTHLIILNKKQT